MKEKVSYIAAVVVIVVIIMVGLALIRIGNTPIQIQIAHLVGFLLFFIGVGLAIIALFIAYIEIHSYFNPSDQKELKN